jgi:hypothetical protein
VESDLLVTFSVVHLVWPSASADSRSSSSISPSFSSVATVQHPMLQDVDRIIETKPVFDGVLACVLIGHEYILFWNSENKTWGIVRPQTWFSEDIEDVSLRS